MRNIYTRTKRVFNIEKVFRALFVLLNFRKLLKNKKFDSNAKNKIIVDGSLNFPLRITLDKLMIFISNKQMKLACKMWFSFVFLSITLSPSDKAIFFNNSIFINPSCSVKLRLD